MNAFNCPDFSPNNQGQIYKESEIRKRKIKKCCKPTLPPKNYFFKSFVTFSLNARSGFGAGARPIFVPGRIRKYSGKVRTS